MRNTSAKAACEQLPTQKTYAPQKNSKPLSFLDQFRKTRLPPVLHIKEGFYASNCLQIKK
jgi:hypothetical protein